MAKLGKRTRAAREKVDVMRSYDLKEAAECLKQVATAKFDETIDVAINLDIDPRQSDQQVRGMVSLPNGLGKTLRVIVFAKGDKAEEAKKAGADKVGAEDLMEEVNKGFMDFDRCIATPDMMGVVGRLGKVLGPRGLMPNPKLGTVTLNIAEAVKAAKSGQVEFRVEKAGIIQAGIGKASFSADAIAGNIRAFIDAVQKAKPSGAKGNFMKKAVVSTTMGPGIRLNLASVLAA